MCHYDDWPVLLEHSPVTVYTGHWCLDAQDFLLRLSWFIED